MQLGMTFDVQLSCKKLRVVLSPRLAKLTGWEKYNQRNELPYIFDKCGVNLPIIFEEGRTAYTWSLNPMKVCDPSYAAI